MFRRSQAVLINTSGKGYFRFIDTYKSLLAKCHPLDNILFLLFLMACH